MYYSNNISISNIRNKKGDTLNYQIQDNKNMSVSFSTLMLPGVFKISSGASYYSALEKKYSLIMSKIWNKSYLFF